jgi:hypothetical protein
MVAINLNRSLFLLTGGSWRKHFACFGPGAEVKYPCCFVSVQSLMARFAALPKTPQPRSPCECIFRSLLPNYRQFQSMQFCYLYSMSWHTQDISCTLLCSDSSIRVGGSPKMTTVNLVFVKQLDSLIEYKSSYFIVPIYILDWTCFDVMYLSLEYSGILPKAEAKPLPCTSAFGCLVPIRVPDYSPFLLGRNPSSHSRLSGNLSVNALINAYLYLSVPIRLRVHDMQIWDSIVI